MKWFKIRNPNSTLRVVHGLEQGMLKGLSLENVTSLHDYLHNMNYMHKYPTTHICNCYEFGAQVGRNGGGCFGHEGAGIQSMYIIMPMRDNS